MKKTLYNVIVCALAGLTMTSCAVFKNYHREKVVGEVQTDGIYGDAQSGDSLGLGDLSWRELFTDPTLQTLIEKALVQNTDVRNTDLQIQQVQYALKASKLAFIPSISFSANGAISKTYDPYNRRDVREAFADNTKVYGATLTMGWQNVNFFALRNQLKGAQVSLEQIKTARQAVQAGLVANVAKLYYTICQLDEQIVFMQQTVDNWKTYWEMQKRLMEAGQANIAAVSSVEATYWLWWARLTNSWTTAPSRRRHSAHSWASLPTSSSTPRWRHSRLRRSSPPALPSPFSRAVPT